MHDISLKDNSINNSNNKNKHFPLFHRHPFNCFSWNCVLIYYSNLYFIPSIYGVNEIKFKVDHLAPQKWLKPIEHTVTQKIKMYILIKSNFYQIKSHFIFDAVQLIVIYGYFPKVIW